MKTSSNLMATVSVFAAGLALLGSPRANALPVGPDPTQAIGINFVNTNLSSIHGVGIDDRPNALLPSEVAGAYPQANWNNAGSFGGGSFVVTNNLGSPVTLTLNWDSAFSDATGAGAGLGTPDGKLMDGFLSTWGPGTNTALANSVYGCTVNNKPLVYIKGLQSWYGGISGAEGYAVVLYTKGYSYWQLNEGWVQSVSGDPLSSTMVEGGSLTPHLFRRDNDAFVGTFAPITSTDPNNPTYNANYMFFSGLTNDAVLLRIQSPQPNYTSSLNGFQLIPVYPAPPTAATPTFAPSDTIYAGETTTLSEVATGDPFHPQLWYQWQTDNGSGGEPNSDLLNETNTTLNIAPPPTNTIPITINYRVIVTNIHGASTSSVVTLNINPAVKPYITQDTTPGMGNGVSAAYAYAGGSISFKAAFGGPQPITYNWQTNDVNLAGETNTTLTVTNLQLSSAANYQLEAVNFMGSTTSTPTPLAILAAPPVPTADTAYPYDVFTNGPVAYWRLNETLDNVGSSLQTYDYSGHNLNGTWGTGGSDYQPAPLAPDFPGFEAANVGAYFVKNVSNSFVTVPPLNLNTNTVTITAWINPAIAQGAGTGLLMWNNGGNKAGLNFGSNTDTNTTMAELGYLWNSSSESSGFHSGLYPPAGQWSFVALTIRPTNSTLYLYYVDAGMGTTNLLRATQTVSNAPAAFSGGTTWLGSDTSIDRNFYGGMDEVAVFNKALSEAQIQDLFLKAIGVSTIAPSITKQPVSVIGPMFPWQEAQITGEAGGAPSPSVKWQWSQPGVGVFTDLVNGDGVAGANASTLLLSGNGLASSKDYRMVAFNPSGSATSMVSSIMLTPVPTNGLWTARYQFTNSSGYLWYDAYGSGSYSGRGILGQGNFWNPIAGHGQWNGGNFASASDYADDGSTHSGVSCYINNAGFSIAAAPQVYAATDRRGLLTQFAYYLPGAGVTVSNAIVLRVPNGTYNLALHGDNANWSDRGTLFTVHGANGDQSDMTTNTTQFSYFVNGDSSVVVTNVQVTNGVLNVDAAPTPSVPNHATNSEFAINAVEVQLVSYSAPTAGFRGSPTNAFVGQSVTFTDTSSPVTNVFWNFGDGNTLNAPNGNVTHAYAAPGSYTVSQTVSGPGGSASVTNTAYVSVVPKPTIGGAAMTAGGLVLSGTTGIEGTPYRILSSTNVALPLANWTPVWTNVFGAGGTYSYTNSPTTNGAAFFILVSP